MIYIIKLELTFNRSIRSELRCPAAAMHLSKAAAGGSAAAPHMKISPGAEVDF